MRFPELSCGLCADLSSLEFYADSSSPGLALPFGVTFLVYRASSPRLKPKRCREFSAANSESLSLSEAALGGAAVLRSRCSSFLLVDILVNIDLLHLCILKHLLQQHRRAPQTWHRVNTSISTFLSSCFSLIGSLLQPGERFLVFCYIFAMLLLCLVCLYMLERLGNRLGSAIQLPRFSDRSRGAERIPMHFVTEASLDRSRPTKICQAHLPAWGSFADPREHCSFASLHLEAPSSAAS